MPDVSHDAFLSPFPFERAFFRFFVPVSGLLRRLDRLTGQLRRRGNEKRWRRNGDTAGWSATRDFEDTRNNIPCVIEPCAQRAHERVSLTHEIYPQSEGHNIQYELLGSTGVRWTSTWLARLLNTLESLDHTHEIGTFFDAKLSISAQI